MSDRDRAIRELVLRALTRPANLLPAAVVAAVGVLSGLWPLYLVAGVLYGTLAATTLFSTDEARKVLASGRAQGAAAALAREAPRLTDSGLATRYREAVQEEERIRAAIAASPIPLAEVEVELVGLVDDLGRLCGRAQSIVDYLESVNEKGLASQRARAESRLSHADADLRPTLQGTVDALGEQLDAIAAMRVELDRFHARMAQLQSNLGAIRAQVVRVTVESQPDASARVVEQLSSARELVGGITRGLDAAAGDALHD